MATASGGAEATGTGTQTPEARGDLMAPDAGEQQKRSRDECHHVAGFDHEESMKLFCLHAFAGGEPFNWQRPYVEDIVKECEGLPLALEVMGGVAGSYSGKEGGTSNPTREEREKWRGAAEGMKQDGLVDRDVFDKVIIQSFRSLGDLSRAVLLDFAMLPKGYKLMPSDMVDLQCSTGFCDELAVRRAVQELEERSLIGRIGEDLSDVPDFQQHNPAEQRDAVCYCMHDVVRDSALRMIQYNMNDILGDNSMTAAELPLAERDRMVSSQLPEAACQHQVLKCTHFSAIHNITDGQLEWLQDWEVSNLRVLVMRTANVSEMLGALLVAQLVALDLTSSGILKLPPQISILKCARLLRLDDCDILESLPSEVGNMQQLSVLSMRECRSLTTSQGLCGDSQI